MKIWISDSNMITHRNIRLNCEAHSDFKFLGDFDDTQLSDFLVDVKPDIDVQKSVKLLHYYGYLHLFIIHKN